jgi:hypothetical protein
MEQIHVDPKVEGGQLETQLRVDNRFLTNTIVYNILGVNQL